MREFRRESRHRQVSREIDTRRAAAQRGRGDAAAKRARRRGEEGKTAKRAKSKGEEGEERAKAKRVERRRKASKG